MLRTCANPACHRAAEAVLSYEYASRMAWLDLHAGPEDAKHLVLCGIHADRMVVPLGWTLEDRRAGLRALAS